MTLNKAIYYDPDLHYTTKCFRGQHRLCNGVGFLRQLLKKFNCDCSCHYGKIINE